jgi:hypothetical protein
MDRQGFGVEPQYCRSVSGIGLQYVFCLSPSSPLIGAAATENWVASDGAHYRPRMVFHP